MIIAYLAWETAYCWRCLRCMPVCLVADIKVWLWEDGRDEKKPICGVSCSPIIKGPVHISNVSYGGRRAVYEYGFVQEWGGKEMRIYSFWKMDEQSELTPDHMRCAWQFLSRLAGADEPAPHFRHEKAIALITADRKAAARKAGQARAQMIAEERDRERARRHIKGKRK